MRITGTAADHDPRRYRLAAAGGTTSPPLDITSVDIFKKVSFESREMIKINSHINSIASLTNPKENTMLYTGIDLHRRVIALCTVNDSGTVIARTKIKTDPQAILTYFHQWSEPHRAVVECTTGWYWFCDLLHSTGIEIILAHAKYLKAISYAKAICRDG